MLFTLQFHITMNECLLFQKHSNIFLSHKDIFIFIFFNVFNLGAKKKNLLHVTHFILSLLPLGQNSFLSRLF